jgi:hypothetical protein
MPPAMILFLGIPSTSEYALFDALLKIPRLQPTSKGFLAAAGEAILARGEDFTPGAFLGCILGEIAILAISLVMLRGRIFSKVSACMGICGSLFLSLFTIWSTFLAGSFDAAMVLAMLGGLSTIAWYILISLRLFRLGHIIKAGAE